jgi:hypothetical protein
MKLKVELSEADIKQAILEFVNKKMQSQSFKTVYLSYYQADSRDPRETSSHSATVSE